jgi:hypothetical protein
VISLASQISEPRTPMARALSPRHVTSFLRSIGNHGIAISPVAIPLQLKTPNVESRPPGISCHLSRRNQRLQLNRESLLAISTSMTLTSSNVEDRTPRTLCGQIQLHSLQEFSGSLRETIETYSLILSDFKSTMKSHTQHIKASA